MKSYLTQLNGYIVKEPYEHDINYAKHVYRRESLLSDKDIRIEKMMKKAKKKQEKKKPLIINVADYLKEYA